MPSYNRTILAGHLTRDPETRHTQSGSAITTFGLAVNEAYKAKDGSKKEEVSFIDCVSFGATAETVGKHLTKGRAVLVEGRLKQDRWDDKESGQKRSAVRVIADRIVFLGGQKEAGAANEEKSQDDIPY